MSTMRMILRRARTWHGRLTDLVVSDGVITHTPPGASATLASATTVDLDGRLVIPGLWDHHLHFTQWALARQRIDLSSATCPSDVLALVRAASQTGARANPENADEILVGVGFRGSAWLHTVAATDLDGVCSAKPVVLIGGDLHSAWLNTAALRRFGIEHSDGIVRENEWFALSERLVPDPHQLDGWVRQAAAAASRRGVVGIVDYEMAYTPAQWRRRFAEGFTGLRVVCGIWAHDLDRAIDEGLAPGGALPGTGGLATVGPVKLIADGSLNSRTAQIRATYPGTEDHGWEVTSDAQLRDLIGRAGRAGFRVAVHAIGDLAVQRALTVFAATGAPGAIEHAQLLQPGDIEKLAERNLAVSIQPAHLLDDIEPIERLWPGAAARAYPWRELADAGIELRLGSDAPVARLDPWLAIAAACQRTWHPEQAIDLDLALTGCLARPAVDHLEIGTGQQADLAVLDADPRDLGTNVADLPVAATMVHGQWTYQNLSR